MKEQNRLEIKQKLISTTFEYLADNGLENSSLRDLCKAIGISTGSLYYWFDGKDNVYINAVKYGINKVANALFQFTLDTMSDPRVFFNSYLDEIDKYKREFRLILQVAASPLYGPEMRTKAVDFKLVYENYIDKLSEMIGCTAGELTPVIYMLISILTDYVVWEDREVSEMQVEHLYNYLTKNLAKNN